MGSIHEGHRHPGTCAAAGVMAGGRRWARASLALMQHAWAQHRSNAVVQMSLYAPVGVCLIWSGEYSRHGNSGRVQHALNTGIKPQRRVHQSTLAPAGMGTFHSGLGNQEIWENNYDVSTLDVTTKGEQAWGTTH